MAAPDYVISKGYLYIDALEGSSIENDAVLFIYDSLDNLVAQSDLLVFTGEGVDHWQEFIFSGGESLVPGDGYNVGFWSNNYIHLSLGPNTKTLNFTNIGTSSPPTIPDPSTAGGGLGIKEMGRYLTNGAGDVLIGDDTPHNTSANNLNAGFTWQTANPETANTLPDTGVTNSPAIIGASF